MSQKQSLPPVAAIQWAANKIGAITKAVKTLAAGQTALTNAIVGDRAKLPLQIKTAATEISTAAVGPLMA